MVGQAIATQSSLRDQLTSPTTANAPTQQWHQYQDASMMWTSTTDTSIDPSICLSYPPSIHSEENDESSSNSCLSEIEEKVSSERSLAYYARRETNTRLLLDDVIL